MSVSLLVINFMLKLSAVSLPNHVFCIIHNVIVVYILIFELLNLFVFLICIRCIVKLFEF